MMSFSPAVSVRDLRVVRGGREVLHGITCDVPAGSVVGLLGPSGCGKTTLMRALVGVQIVQSGTVTVLGEPAGSPGLRRRVGYATQTPAVYTDLTVAENLRYFASVLGAPRTDVDRVIEEVGPRREPRPGRGNAVGRAAQPHQPRRRAAGRARAARAGRADRRPRPGAAPRAVGVVPPRWPTGAAPSSSPATSWTRRSAATGSCSCARAASSPTARPTACARAPARPTWRGVPHLVDRENEPGGTA